MKHFGTTLTCLLLAALVGLPAAQAQTAEPLGDEFVFFVEGVNPDVPDAGVSSIIDPDDAENRILPFGGGNFAYPALLWPAPVGVDASQNRVDGDTLFMKVRISDDARDGEARANIYFMMLDSESLNNNGDPGDDDIAFRAIWPLPDSLFDNEWHDLVLPLPPATVAELEAIDDEANPVLGNWQYQGGYNPDGATFVTPGSELFMEFSWDAVQSFGFFWDQGSGPGGTVFVDDFYVGSVNTDLSPYEGEGAAYTGTITTTPASDKAVTVSFTPQEGAGGYNLYVVDGPDADVTDPTQAQLVRRFPAGAEALTLDYTLFSPHPAVPNPQVTFAVTVQSEAGIENPNAVYQTATLEGAEAQGYLFPMTPAEVDGLFEAFSSQTLDVSFLDLDAVTPFLMGPNNGTVADEGAIENAEDLTVELYLGYAPDPDFPDDTILMVYADVTDDAIFFDADNGEGAPVSNEPFLFDRIALFMGLYDVPFPVGSANGGLLPGEDYAINFQPVADESGNITVWPSIAESVLFSRPLFEYKEEGGERTGWRMLAAFLGSDLGDEETPSTFVRPEASEIVYRPVIFGFDEQDGTGGFATRTNIVHSEKANVNFVGPGWYASPLQWPATAVAGDAVNVATEDETVPGTFALQQNYPNPFNPVTSIAFSLDEAATVQLEVFNLLGQKVATLVDGRTMPAGAHQVTFDATDLSSGVYFYRIAAGRYEAARQMVLLK